MERSKISLGFRMRNVLPTVCILTITQFAIAQSTSPDTNTGFLTVRISQDGVCHVLDDAAPCEKLGKYLLAKHLDNNKNLRIVVDRDVKYELVAATVKSLHGTGFQVGYVNNELW